MSFTFVRGRHRIPAAALVAVVCCLGSSARADDAGAPELPDAGAVVAPPVLDPKTPLVRALIQGTLEIGVDPATLFDVALTDETAVQIEAVRVRALLRTLEEASPKPPPPTPKKGPKTAGSAAPASSTQVEIAALDAARWQARVELDRARLEFYALPAEQRAALLSDHATRVEAAKPKETDEERRLREAEKERQRALEAARLARSEAERLVGEELARLIGVERSVLSVRERFKGTRDDLATRKDTVLGWQRRARDAKSAAATDVDAVYDALRRNLLSSRDELGASLDAANAATSDVPAIGADPLQQIPPDISTDQVRERRAVVNRLIQEVTLEEQSLREERAAALLEEVSTLNRERLGLLPYLSSSKRDAITGLTAAGLDQARSELRHLVLSLRYHQHVAAGWIRSIRGEEGLRGASVWGVLAVVLQWIVVGIALLWWRRKSMSLLALAAERLDEAQRADQPSYPSWVRRALQIARAVQRPLEWLLFLWITAWLLPDEAKALLEVQLVTVIVGWTLGGALIVNVVNALAATAEPPGGRAADEAAALRFRSLRLVGGVVVAFALVLLLSARLVGEGTVYQWVLSTCWFSAIPVFLILVRWWRETVFLRVERVRRKSRVQAWVLANRRGYKSFFAAMIAAIQLFSLGVVKTVRNWLASFDLARRVHAYLFKRELDRLAVGNVAKASKPLHAEALVSLSPDRFGETWVACPADAHLDALIERVSSARGGIVALVGERGIGKSTVVRNLASKVSGSIEIPCPTARPVADIEAMLRDVKVGAEEGAAPADPPLVILDDSDELVKPILGGLKAFDELLSFLRARCERTLWVLVIDGVVWPFLRRARDSRPLFDEVFALRGWTDEQIGALLSSRSAEAEVVPTFHDLLEKLPPSADEIDKQEALSAKKAGYFRMVWDYARGNPAMALEVWRSSLVEGEDGTVRVRPLHAPRAEELEELPDSVLFVIRAVLQMAPATVADVSLATRLSEGQVHNAFRFGLGHGYLVEEEGKVSVTWAWLRSIVLLLDRRHLLVRS